MINDRLKHLEERAEKALEGGALTMEMIAFYRALYGYQAAEYDRHAQSPETPALAPDDLPVAAKGRRALFNEKTSRLLAPGLAPLLEIMAAHHPGLELAPLRDALESDPLKWIGFAEALFDSDPATIEQMAHGSKAGVDELIFVMINWLKPLLVRLRESYAGPMPDDDTLRACPFCGYFPEMSLILGDREGKRHLSCSLCENIWPYKRIACSVCGMEDAERLEYLTAEGDDRYRIDLCHQCKGYIKTVRLAKFEETEECDPSVENILTVHLDSAALKRGFHRP